MSHISATFTYIGGPTALIEVGGLRLLTDPTFDPAGTDYPTKIYVLHKLADPAIGVAALGHIDAVLLSHDHHFDNLDHAGREMLKTAGTVLTTQAGAERLGGNAAGLAHWEHRDFPLPEGGALRITATPARHGPADGDRGPVIGFAITAADSSDDAVYLSGDSVWYEGVEEVGPAHLTFSAEEAVQAARTFPNAAIVPLHYEGWGHFSENRAPIQAAFEAAGLAERVKWLEPGRPQTL